MSSRAWRDNRFCQSATAEDEVCRGVEEVVVSVTTPFQRCVLWRSKTLGLCVTIDDDLQSTEMDCSAYHEALVHPAMLLHGAPRKVLICGGGEGATAREVLRYRSVQQVVMVDIDEVFVDLCKQYLDAWHRGAFDDPRLEVRFEDIFEVLAQSDETYDVIIGDLTDVVDEIAPGKSFHSVAFYESLAKRLRPGGVIATQGSALALFDHSNHVTIRAHMGGVFDHTASYRATLDSFFVPWGFVVASNKTLPPITVLEQVIEQRWRDAGLELEHFDARSLAACFALNKRLRALVDAEMG